MEDTGERLIPEGHTQSLTYGEHLSRYSSVLDIVKGKVVLDIASGAGYGTNLIATSAKQVTGVDYSKEAIEYSKGLYKSKNLEFIQGDAQNLPLDDKAFDVVVSLETIEHLQDPEKFVNEFSRVLKPGGVFIVSTPNDDEYIEGNEFHLHEFHLGDLRKLIQKYFKKSEFYYQGSYFAAGLYSEDVFKNGGYWQGSVAKTFGQKPSKAIYFQVVASDEQVPKLLETTIVADAWSTKDDLARDAAIRADRQVTVAQIEAANQEMERITKVVSQLSSELADIKTSYSWKVVERLREIKSRLRR